MASPQVEHGHSRVANELMMAFARYPFTSANAMRILVWTLRHSYGWNKKKANPRSLKDIAMDTGMMKSCVHKGLQYLLKENIILRDDKGRLGIQKDYEAWGGNAVQKLNAVHHSGRPSTTVDDLQKSRDGSPSRAVHHSGRLKSSTTVDGPSTTVDAYKDKALTDKAIRHGACANPAKEYKADTPQQKIVCAYKVAKGIAWDDRGWDTDNYSRAAKAAGAVLRAFDQKVKPAAEFVVAFGERMDKAGRSWTLETAAKWAWDTKGERSVVNQDPGGDQ